MAHQSFFKSDMRPAALERADRRRARTTADERESEKVKVRSCGQCEVVVMGRLGVGIGRVELRCQRRACEVNHLLSGIGVRGRGESAKAIRKIHMCQACHSAYHAHILTRIGGSIPRWDDAYTRAR